MIIIVLFVRGKLNWKKKTHLTNHLFWFFYESFQVIIGMIMVVGYKPNTNSSVSLSIFSFKLTNVPFLDNPMSYVSITLLNLLTLPIEFIWFFFLQILVVISQMDSKTLKSNHL